MNRFFRRPLVLLVLVLPLLSAAEEVRWHELAWELKDGLCEPETVIHEPGANLLLVSNICGYRQPGTGYLSRVSLDGAMIDARWLEGLDAPAGMALRNGKLYVADRHVVRVVDAATGRIERRIAPQPQPGALNDIAVDRDGAIYLSDSARHQVIRIDSSGSSVFPPDTLFKYANGLHISDRQLLVGGWRLWSVHLQGHESQRREVRDISVSGLRDIDGIEATPDGRLIVSIVGGAVWYLPNAGAAVIWNAPGLSSTNHAYLPERRLVIVPTGFDNTLLAFRVNPE